MSTTIDLMLFDLAGTLMEDGPYAREAYRAVLEEAGLPVDLEWLRARMGRRKAEVLGDALELAGRDRRGGLELAGRFDAAILEHMRRDPPVALPGAVDLLGELRGLGVRTGYTTGFGHATAEHIAETLGFRFDVGAASDEVDRGRPAPDLIERAMERANVTDAARVGTAGDTPNDLKAGAAAGCRVIVGLGHGTHSLAELRPHPHSHLLEDLEGFVARTGIAR